MLSSSSTWCAISRMALRPFSCCMPACAGRPLTFSRSIPVPLRAVTHLPPLGRAGSHTSAYLARAA
ncbi:Uncharacterised protein [Bordetella pertussis]|nr:Uncharacterised protein [Bordetella pertussis]